MPPKKTPKQPPTPATIHATWFPAYGIRLAEIPHVIVYGKTELDAMQKLAAFTIDEGKRRNSAYDVKFSNEVFEVD